MAPATAVDPERAVALFHALSDPTRLGVLELLRDGEQCVCDLQASLDVAQSRLSFHLRVLKDAGLVEDRKAGRWSYYTVVPAALDEARELLGAMTPRAGAGAGAEPRVSGSGAAGSCCA